MNLSVRPLTPEQKEEKNYIALDCYKLGLPTDCGMCSTLLHTGSVRAALL